MNLLDKLIVIKLNKHWVAYDTLTVKAAITFLHSQAKDGPTKGKPPGFAVDFETVTNAAGEHVLTFSQPVKWEDWMKLPVREQDLWIGVGKSEHCLEGRIRVPLVVICANYDKIPPLNPRLTREAVLQRDGYTCQYTGRKLPKHLLNLDHVIPRDRGGEDSWENLVASDKEINTLKGNRLNSEAGLKLIRKPVAPKSAVKVLTAADAKHPSQVPFLL